ncbi:18.1 kDa class I heat shock protein-like [Punica granatum]|uniref:SHSP domain-containing protein n=2 Tax=Punica granatum TaxID=22663 RepID=A0A218W2H8_PUNGR|nr:18.1 kDa class I heat shock protein-like [Punica granatum]OWM66729.1 hypothetical protein CDL15_Pgr010380 [Punica granatum]PKI32276.1 hypothetical protein CRG98_047362 [Punica granatum]
MSIVPISDRRRRGGTGDSDGDPFSLEVWDAFDSFRDHVFSSLDTWRPFTADFPLPFPDSFGDFLPGPFSPARTNNRIDWKETRDAHVFRGYFPGLGRDDVVVEVRADRVLKIRGGNFSTTFELPENARLELVTADMAGGQLTVTIPKDVEERRPSNVRVVEIED